MTSQFESDTAVRRAGATTSGGVRYEAEVAPGWDIGGNANGGYLLAIAGRAMADAVERPPLSITAHYLAPAPAGACTVEVDVVRAGRRTATATASLRQGDRELIRVLGTFAEQTSDGPVMVTADPLELPPYDRCADPPSGSEGPRPAIQDRLAVRLRPEDAGFRAGRPSGRAEMAGWFAFRDERPIDAFGLLLAADAMPPAIFNTDLPVAWVPTLELTVHVRGVPAPGPLACVFRSRFVHGGLLEEDGELFDSTGALVAMSRQLALTPR